MASTYGHAKVNGVYLFTTNTKTDCPSWALSQLSCSGAKGCEICKNCYAKRGKFGISVVQNALNKRYEWFQNSTESEVVNTIVAEIKHFGHEYFRVHVSGDFQNTRAIRIWTKIATQLPEVRFWFPTKAYRVKSMLPALKKLNTLSNATVRPSAAEFDVVAPAIDGLAPGATAYKKANGPQDGHFDCPGDCSKCRVCWNSDNPVTYHYH